MPELEYFIVAESFSVDQSTNRVSIFNVLEQIQAAELPAYLPQMVAIAHWNIADDEIGKDFQVELIAFVDDPVSKCHTNFKATFAKHRTLVGFARPKFNSAGKHKIELKLNGDHKAYHEITVIHSPELAVKKSEPEALGAHSR